VSNNYPSSGTHPKQTCTVQSILLSAKVYGQMTSTMHIGLRCRCPDISNKSLHVIYNWRCLYPRIAALVSYPFVQLIVADPSRRPYFFLFVLGPISYVLKSLTHKAWLVT